MTKIKKYIQIKKKKNLSAICLGPRQKSNMATIASADSLPILFYFSKVDRGLDRQYLDLRKGLND